MHDKIVDMSETTYEAGDYRVSVHPERGSIELSSQRGKQGASLTLPKPVSGKLEQTIRSAGLDPKAFVEVGGVAVRKEAAEVIEKAYHARKRLKDMERAEEEGSYGSTFAPEVTFQYSPEGQESPGEGMKMPLREDSPAIYRRRMMQQWHGSKHADKVWIRLQELVQAKLEKLPDNKFVQQEAWLAGLAPMPEDVKQSIETQRTKRQSRKDWVDGQFAAAKKTGKPVVLSVDMGEQPDNDPDEKGGPIRTTYAMPDGTKKTETTYGY